MKFFFIGAGVAALLLLGAWAVLPRNANAPKASPAQAMQQQQHISSNQSANKQLAKINQQPAQYQVGLERMFDQEGKPLGQIRLTIYVNDQPTSQFFVPEEDFAAKVLAARNASPAAPSQVPAGPVK